jgi:oxygen-independent coproporphyrinogen-3 oxidase
MQKCPYCDFNSHNKPKLLPEDQYITALIKDLTQDIEQFGTRPLHSIFIGGGTPSLLSANAYDTLFQAIDSLLPFHDTLEITLEANPGTVEQQRFCDYRALGINRLSLGIQSFNAAHLKTLGRIHDDKQAHRAIDAARHAGFDNLNIDIMHGLPRQTIQEGLQDLQTALSYQPQHISWYQLTIEPNTVFYKTRPVLPSEDDLGQLEDEGLRLLLEHGLNRYEISAFCEVGKESRHNLNYWLFGDYYGIGAGAHGKLTTQNDQQVYRTRKHRQPADYLNPHKSFMAELNTLDASDLVFEFMLNTTRLEQDIANSLFTERTGLAFEHLKRGLDSAAGKKLISLNKTHWRVTPLGRRYTNDLQELFLDNESRLPD